MGREGEGWGWGWGEETGHTNSMSRSMPIKSSSRSSTIRIKGRS